MEQIIDTHQEPLLQMLQRRCADLATWLSRLSRMAELLNRVAEPPRPPEPGRPDTSPSRIRMPTRQPTPSRSQ